MDLPLSREEQERLRAKLEEVVMPECSSIIVRANDLLKAEGERSQAPGKFWLTVLFYSAAHIVGRALSPQHQLMAERMGKIMAERRIAEWSRSLDEAKKNGLN